MKYYQNKTNVMNINNYENKLTRKKYRLYIPNQISTIYENKQNQILFINKNTKKKRLLIKLNVKLFLIKMGYKSILQITHIQNRPLSNCKKKKLKAEQGTVLSRIKYALIELFVTIFCQRMKFIGIGYRGFRMIIKKKPFIYLRLGYCHQIYINFLKKVNFFIIKFTKLYIFGNSYPQVKQTASLIRSYRKPSIYKIKGILYENEKVKLKRGKRV
jgi:large subunit ribosomal protein L6